MIAEDGRERGAQLVAGIGDEIDAHSLGSASGRAIGEPEEDAAGAERMGQHLPVAPATAEPRKFERRGRFAGGNRCEMGCGSRLADRKTHILADDVGAEKIGGGCIRVRHALALHEQQRLVDRRSDGGKARLGARLRRGRGRRRGRAEGEPAGEAGSDRCQDDARWRNENACRGRGDCGADRDRDAAMASAVHACLPFWHRFAKHRRRG